MAKNKKAKKPVQSYDTPQKAIKERARKLPIHECLISDNWHKLKMAEIVISRKHSNGNITYGVFLVDLYCTGLRDTFYNFNINQKDYLEMLKRISGKVTLTKCSYSLAHNIIFGSIEYAEQFGFDPDNGFSITEFILEEDNENIPLLDINFGYKGKPTIILFKDNNSDEDIEILKSNAGEGNYSIFDAEKSPMHSDPENSMFDESKVTLEEFLNNSSKDKFNEAFFMEYVKGAFNKKLIEDEELRHKNKLTFYINDLIDFAYEKEEGLVKIKDEAVRAKYFEFYESVNDQKSKKIKKIIPEIEQYYETNKTIPEFAALLLKCYNDTKENEKFENLIEKSIKEYPIDFSTRSVALDHYLSNDDYDAILKLFNGSYTINDYTKGDRPVNNTEAKLFHLAYFYYFLEKQNLAQAEEYLKALPMFIKDEKQIRRFLLKLTLAKMYFIDERQKVESNLPKDVLDLT